ITKYNVLTKNIREMIDLSVAAYNIFVNDEMVCSLESQEAADNTLNTLKKTYQTKPEVKVDFACDVKVEKGYVSQSQLRNVEQAVKLLAQDKQAVKNYTVQDKDTLWSISVQQGLNVESILTLNPGMSDSILPGQIIKLSAAQPTLPVKTIEKVVYEENVAFEVNAIENADAYLGNREVIEQGQTGKQQVEAEVTKINGKEIQKNVLQTAMITPPKAQTEKVGIKPVPTRTGSGSFIRPSYGNVSSRFGRRWGNTHTGLDLAGPIGSPVEASDGGIVQSASYEGGFGRLIKINHENGFVTYYAHLSSIDVKQGQRVIKGQNIGKVGNSGNSTGPHLHFEVRKDGTPVDPEKYLGR
ncbi:MAG: peptidoglycan DD-metalloendopeptidase family protein, partial [Hyphomonadaceae bacterium]|nr:peptidoglycan DD-metalloendopeptidase family protein [Clostridia bacterium]